MSVLQLVMGGFSYALFDGHFLQILVLTLALSVVLAGCSTAWWAALPAPQDLGRRPAAIATATERAVSTR